ncbi:MAG: hypothetical protein QXU69_06670 [Thermofilaceae archaeon]
MEGMAGKGVKYVYVDATLVEKGVVDSFDSLARITVRNMWVSDSREVYYVTVCLREDGDAAGLAGVIVKKFYEFLAGESEFMTGLDLIGWIIDTVASHYGVAMPYVDIRYTDTGGDHPHIHIAMLVK